MLGIVFIIYDTTSDPSSQMFALAKQQEKITKCLLYVRALLRATTGVVKENIGQSARE